MSASLSPPDIGNLWSLARVTTRNVNVSHSRPGTMIKNTLEIPHGCFYTQLKVFIGVKSTMNCNPSWPAAMPLASLDCAYLYWPPPHHLLTCCLLSPVFTLAFDEPVNDKAFSTDRLVSCFV